jgi:hypothetical protein
MQHATQRGVGSGPNGLGKIMIGAVPERFSIGRVIGDSFGVYARNFAGLSLLALLIGLVELLVTIFYLLPNQVEASGEFRVRIGGPGEFTVYGFDALVLIFIMLLTYSLTQAAITYGTFQDLRGDKAGVGVCVARGLTSMFPVILGSIVFTIAIGLASILLLVPGIILMTRWWVYIPSIVVERKSILDSLGRSSELTAGNRWTIFGLIIIVSVLTALMTFVAQVITVFVVAVPAIADIPYAPFVVDYIGSSLITAYGAVAVAVGYCHLRAEKEGIDANQIASVFD